MILHISRVIQLHEDKAFSQFVAIEKKEMVDTANKGKHLFFHQFTLGSGENCSHREVNPLLINRQYIKHNEMKFKLNCNPDAFNIC